MGSAIDAFLSELRSVTVYEVGADGARNAVYGPGDEMAAWHMDNDAARMSEFLSLLSRDGWSGLRVLDLGANPYLLTFALARLGAAVVATGHPVSGITCPPGQECVQFVRPSGEVVANVPLVRFNVEQDRFPFEAGSFDAVVCGEIIEHLPSGPDHMLYECNRVLIEGGLFLLSTPNAVSLARLIAILRGTNPEWPFSAQGIYGRHNRTYSAAELRDLLIGNGLSPFCEKGLTYLHRRSWYPSGAMGTLKWLAMVAPQHLLAWQPHRLRRWAEGLLLAAHKVGEPRVYRPAWLFGAADSVPMWAENAGGASPHAVR